MPDSRIAVFIGSKGGSGTTTLCRELVRKLREDGNTALVDADLTGRRSIALLLDIVRSLDTARSTSPISSARCDGVSVVELAERYDAAFSLEEETVEAFVSGMTGFDTIVVDAPQPFAATVRPFIARAARFFIVLEPTLLGAAGAQQMVADLQRFGIPPERIELVTNARSEIRNGAARRYRGCARQPDRGRGPALDPPQLCTERRRTRAVHSIADPRSTASGIAAFLGLASRGPEWG